MKSYNPMYSFENNTTTLFTEGQKCLGEFYVRGGICWPVMMQDPHTGDDDYRGFAICGALEITTQVLHIVAERVFSTIKHLRNPENLMIEKEGLAPWFSKMWNDYYCKSYYWNQDSELNKRFLLDAIRTPEIEPKPIFIEVTWANHSEAKQMIWQYLKEKRIELYQKGGFSLAEQLAFEKRADLDKLVYPGTHALQCLIAALERYPYRKRRRK